MATLTIRNLDDTIKQRLRVRAASHNHSMEEEVRRILRGAVEDEEESRGMGSRIHDRFIKAGGIDLPEPLRDQAPRKPETFE